MSSIDEAIKQQVWKLQRITLPEMKCIKLMNRTDTKFVTSKSVLLRLLEMAEEKYYAQQIDDKRISEYRTVYWDTDEYFFYTEHHNGRAPRQKVRVRTYMDSGENYIEIKTKNNHKRTKKKRITIPDYMRPGEDASVFVEELTGRSLTTLHPALQNHFERITLVNYDKTERLTIDFNVDFHNFDTNLDSGTGDLVIVELKRDGNVFSPILEILRDLRIEPSGFSKYCIGSALTNPGLKQNNLKPKLQNVNRLVVKGAGKFA